MQQLPNWMIWAHDIAEILGVLATVIALAVGYAEYRKARTENKQQNDRLKAECAVKMAEIFATKIIPIWSETVKLCAPQRPVRLQIVEAIKYQDELCFDYDELKKTVSPKLFDTLCKANTSPEAKEFNLKAPNLLNELEWICMNLNNNIASEKVVYQSLHFSFISIMQFFYCDICIMNKGIENQGPCKLFTNCIDIYNKWNRRRMCSIREQKSNLEHLSSQTQHIMRKGRAPVSPLE